MDRRLRWIALATSGLLFSQVASAQSTSEDPVDSEEVVELSPFTVEADENIGYLATTTLAGTRIKTDLRDVGSAVSVVTREFMEDTGTTNEDLLVYTVSTEVGGAVGNFGGSALATADEGANRGARANPQNNNRVRGLSRAQSTRDYFLTDFGFDGYNSSAITISRGPNSILFGIGEPGGIIENSIRQAMLHNDTARVSLRYGSRNSHRETVDINKVLIEDRLAIRLMGMNEKINFQQEPTYEDDTRWTISGTWKLFKNENIPWLSPTMIRGNYEDARIRSTPVNTMPPGDSFSHWWQPPASVEADNMVGIDRTEYRENYGPQWVTDDFYKVATTPGNKHQSQPGIWNSYAVVFGDMYSGAAGVGFPNNDVQVIDGNVGSWTQTLPDGTTRQTPRMPLRSTHLNEHATWYPGFRNRRLLDTEVFDFINVFLPGRAQFVNQDFEAYNIKLEQNMFNNTLGFELAYDHQEKDELTHFPLGRHIYHSVMIDTALYMTNGEPNPNVGRPYIAGMWDPEDFRLDERESMRLTGYYNLDFTKRDNNIVKWFGNHTVTGMLSSWENDRRSGSNRLSWDDSHDPDQQFRQNQNRPGSWGGSMFFMAYVGDPQFNTPDPSQVRLLDRPLEIDKPEVGDFYNNYYYDKFTSTLNYSTIRVQEFLQWPGGTRQEVDSEAFTVQSKFLQDHLVLTYGWREDTTKTFQIRNNSFRDPETFAYSPEAYVNGWLQDDGSVGTIGEADPVLDQSGDTATTQGVLHVPDRWMNWGGETLTSLSFHFADSENFNPASVRRDVWNDVIGNPSGDTSEYGFTVGLFNDKAIGRFTWYETTSNNITNPNMQGSMWMLRWPLSLAQRWMVAKNQSFQPGGLQFEDYAWHGPNGPGPDSEGATYQPERLGNFNSFDEVINAFIASFPDEAVEGYQIEILGDPGNQEVFFTNPQGLSTVSSAISEGFEAEIMFNPTPNWRVAFNASQSESMFGGGLKQVTPFVEQTTQNLQNLGLWTINDSPNEGGTVEGRWSNSTLSAYYSALSRENTVSAELREWRWNAVTNYNFTDGMLRGFGVGGALRWQDDVATGYPLVRNDQNILVPDLDNPYYGDSRLKGDLWLSYKTKLWERNVRFQLNFQNLLGDDDIIPVSANPDGTLAVARIPEEKRIFFTTTIDF